MLTQRPHILVDAQEAVTRGQQRGKQLKTLLTESFDRYLELFHIGGRDTARVRDDGLRTLDTLQNWQSRYAEEIAGVASASTLEPWQVAALNARTEILSIAKTALPGECSTIAKRAIVDGSASIFSIQTWDWHIELDDYWHTQQTRGFGHTVVGLTEAGILGKAGMNSAGLGTHFNILGHREDAPGGVPMHVLATAILEQCSNIEEATEMVRHAPISASSAFTLVDETSAVSVELSPSGVFSVPLVDERVVRTNHFLTESLQQSEKTELYQPDSSDRMDLIQSRFARYPEPRQSKELLAFLYSDADQAPLCAVPDMSKSFGERWATLATLLLEPAARTMQIAAGSPIAARAGDWTTLTAH